MFFVVVVFSQVGVYAFFLSILFHIAASGTRCVVHGDDFAFVAPREDVQRMELLMKAWYQIKVRELLGSGANDDTERSFLNRLARRMSGSIEVEADSKHRLLVTEHFGLDVLTALGRRW